MTADSDKVEGRAGAATLAELTKESSHLTLLVALHEIEC
jgi:hypothetical protein